MESPLITSPFLFIPLLFAFFSMPLSSLTLQALLSFHLSFSSCGQLMLCDTCQGQVCPLLFIPHLLSSPPLSRPFGLAVPPSPSQPRDSLRRCFSDAEGAGGCRALRRHRAVASAAKWCRCWSVPACPSAPSTSSPMRRSARGSKISLSGPPTPRSPPSPPLPPLGPRTMGFAVTAGYRLHRCGVLPITREGYGLHFRFILCCVARTVRLWQFCERPSVTFLWHGIDVYEFPGLCRFVL